MKTREYIINQIDEIDQVAKLILDDLDYKVVLFIGDLGAGKTTLIKSFLKLLNCEDFGSSPSFAIINQYKASDAPIYHIDLYRLENPEEAFHLGIEELLYSGHYCFIEWPQIIKDYLDGQYHTLTFEILQNNARRITLS